MSNSAKKSTDVGKFPPFRRYLDNRDALTKHISATELAYGIAVCTLCDSRLEVAEKTPPVKASNFSKADFGVKDIKRLYGWVTLREYAELESLPITEVRKRSIRGDLGKVQKHPKSKANIVIWPTSNIGTPEADSLVLGMSKWSVETREPGKVVHLSVDTENHGSLDEARSDLIFHGRRLGDPTSVYEEAQELFYRGSLLNLWSCFEIFIKDSFGELVRRFPMSLANLPDWKKLTFVYADLVTQTGGLQDISPLREALIASEIAKSETGGRSISGLINLMKSIFRWPSDLYQRPYQEGNVVLRTAYSDLNELKEVRNALAHQRSREISALNGSKRLKFVDDRPVVDREYFKWAELVLSAIAHGISEDVMQTQVSVRA